MPPRRRPARIAAALPASRLPLGTPLLGPGRLSIPHFTFTHDIGPASPLTSPPRHSFLNKENTPLSITAKEVPTEPITADTDDMSTTNLAQAKLERQRKREEDFDAIMNAPLLHTHANPEKERQPVPRPKGKWKPLDIWTPSAGSSKTSNLDGLPVSEVRINTFRPASRASTLNRSMSSLSQQSNDTGISELDRRGSQEGHFQLFSRHKVRRGGEQLSAYADEPQQRQQTVEATFDQHEIYQVFGSKPPGMEFIEQNIGDKSGQLQFVQHPNGDISAHQWSAERFLWENIGQFSNIRKRVEGQLAADCLKGETAEQALQRNTLAYFRTIAKQREASVMGHPFGLKEIQAAMPDARPLQKAMPSATPLDITAHNATDVLQDHMHQSLPPSVQAKPEEIISPPRAFGEHNVTFQQATPHAYFAYGQQYFAPPQRYNRQYVDVYGTSGAAAWPATLKGNPQEQYTNVPSNFNTTGARLDDPFYSTSGRSSLKSDHTITPSILKNERNEHHAIAPTRPRGRTSTLGFTDQVIVPSSEHINASTPRDNSLGVPSRDVTPLTKRGDRGSAFKDQVDIFTGQAMKRSLSQNNMKQSGLIRPQASVPQPNMHRTVLYDPMRDLKHDAMPSTKPAPDRQASMQLVVRDESPIMYKAVPNTTLQLQQQQQLTGPHQVKTHLPMPNSARRGPLRRQLPLPIGTDVNTDPRSSVESDSHTCLVDPDAPWPQNFKGPFFAAEAPPSALKPKKSHDEELRDWWTNGGTLARREGFYQSLLASSRLAGDSPTAPNPNDNPKQSSLPEGTMTRIFIPVLENLASYVEGPVEKRRDCFSRWCQPPEWCIDRSPNGNNSFFDSEWGQPPARVGRDPRYQPLPVESVRFGGFTTPQRVGSGVALDPRLAFAGVRR